jgi:hypothetical protein
MEHTTALALARLDRRLEPLLEAEMRRALLREWLAEASAEEACLVMAAALARNRPADLLRRAISEVLTGATGERLSYAVQRDLYGEAARQENAEIMRLLRSAPAREELEDPERLLSPELAEMPLGRRRALAKGSRPEWLEQLARDCDRVVIANLLRNPRIVEADVLRMAGMRPVAASSLVEIARSPRWSVRVAIRRALARNPYCPVEIATGLVASLPLEELRAMRGDPDLHPETRAQLELELERRRPAPSARDPEADPGASPRRRGDEA